MADVSVRGLQRLPQTLRCGSASWTPTTEFKIEPAQYAILGWHAKHQGGPD
jgi:hypothetical protein